MSNYRLYFMTRDSFHIEDVKLIDEPDDVGAIRVAGGYAGHQPLELYEGNRLVLNFWVSRFTIKMGAEQINEEALRAA